MPKFEKVEALGFSMQNLQNKAEVAIGSASVCDLAMLFGWFAEADDEAAHIARELVTMAESKAPYYKRAEALEELVKGFGLVHNEIIAALVNNCGCRNTSTQRM